MPEDGLDFTGKSYDNTGDAGRRHAGATWPSSSSAAVERRAVARDGGRPRRSAEGRTRLRWLMASDVCKHCTHAACLEVCPTGALFRTEFGTVVVQEDVCNGCGYCVPACPFGVLDRREGDGRAWKCTLCYDRLKDGRSRRARRRARRSRSSSASSTSCASARRARLEQLAEAGETGAQLYGADTGRRRRRGGRVLPAARRAGGLRAAARPGRLDARSRPDVARRGGAAATRCGWSPGCGAGRGGPPAGPAEPAAVRVGRPGGTSRAPCAAPRRTATRRCPPRTRTARLLLRAAGDQAAGVEGLRSPGTSSPAGWRGRPRRSPRSPGVRGNRALERRAWATALAALAVSPVLLIADLGRPERFLNMLRVVKVTSPMSVGLAAHRRRARDRARRRPSLARLVPARGRRGGGGRRRARAAPLHVHGRAASPTPRCRRGTRRGASCRSCSPAHPRPARAGPGVAADARRPRGAGAAAGRGGGVGELGRRAPMERRLGELAEPYRAGTAGRLARTARACTAAGAGIARRARRAAARRGRAAGRCCWPARRSSAGRCSRPASRPRTIRGTRSGRSGPALGLSPGSAGQQLRDRAQVADEGLTLGLPPVVGRAQDRRRVDRHGDELREVGVDRPAALAREAEAWPSSALAAIAPRSTSPPGVRSAAPRAATAGTRRPRSSSASGGSGACRAPRT